MKRKHILGLAWALGSVVGGVWMLCAYVRTLPTVVSVSVRGRQATTLRVKYPSYTVYQDDRYSDVGNWQRLYFLLPHDFNLDQGAIIGIGPTASGEIGEIEPALDAAKDLTVVRGLLRLAVEDGGRFTLPHEQDRGWRILWSKALVLLVGFIVFAALILAVVAVVLVLLRQLVVGGMMDGDAAARRKMWLAVLIVIAIRLFIGTSRGVVEVAADPLNYVRDALSIYHGEWLGSFASGSTIMKSLAYPILMAGSFWLHLPYNTVLDSCWLMVALIACLAVRPCLSRRACLGLFVALAICPVQQIIQTVAIQPPYGIVVAFCFVSFCGLLMRVDRPLGEQLGWLAAYAGSFCLLEFFREERQYFELVFAGFGVLYAATLWVLKLEQRLLKIVAVVAIPLVTCFLYWFPVSALNYSHYGLWGSCERRNADFLKAIGTAVGVGMGEDPAYDCRIPIRRETIRKLAAASPAWRELAPFLDTEAAVTVGNGEQMPQDVAEFPDLLTEPKHGWFVWDIRSAIVYAEHGSNWYCVRDFYRRLYGELKSAMVEGRLKGCGVRASANPPVTGTVVARTLRAWSSMMRFLFWDVMNLNIALPRPATLIDHTLFANWIENPEIPSKDRAYYTTLLERDTRPSCVLTLTGWGKTPDGKALSREWFRCPVLSYSDYSRPDIGSDANYGFVVTVPVGTVTEVGDGENPPLYRGNPALERHGNNVHFDIVKESGATVGTRKRLILNAVLTVLDALMPYFFLATLASMGWLVLAYYRRRDRLSFIRMAIPLLGIAMALGYSAVLALGYAFLQCQYRAMGGYLIPAVTVYWISGCMAIMFVLPGLIGAVKGKWWDKVRSLTGRRQSADD